MSESREQKAAVAKGTLSMCWMAETCVFCPFRTRSTLVWASLGSTAPHEVAGLAFQWEWNCDTGSMNTAMLPVVAMLATPVGVEGRVVRQAGACRESTPQEIAWQAAGGSTPAAAPH